jgi:two-component system LytT family response regulator
MEIGAIIVDDELKNQVMLEKMLEKCHYKIKLLGKAFSVAEARLLIEEHQPRLVFLDVEMPGGNGFTLLESLTNPSFDVVFTTAHDSYALKAFKYAAADYLLKPINYKELLDSLKRLITKYENESEPKSEQEQQASFEVLKNSFTDDFSFTKIALPSSDGLDFVELDNIIRCEADRSYCNFYLTDNSKVLVSKSLKEFEDLLEEAGFFRVHKSNMINLKHIKKYVRGTGGYVVMKDDTQVTVSARRKDLLLSLLSKGR